jgi:hypothetical protein
METIDIINAIAANNKIDAMDKINDHLYAKAAEAMKGYKEVLAKSYFASAEENEEEQVETETSEEGTEE